MLMLRLMLYPLHVDDIISKEEENDNTLIMIYELVPLTLCSGPLFPRQNIAYVFGSNLPGSLMMHSRR